VESAEDHPEVAGQSMSNLSAIASSEHLSQRTVSSSGSSSSRSRTGSAISDSKSGSSARSRAQSLIQTVGTASRSSLGLVQTTVRLRAHSSMARLEEDLSSHSDASSQPGSHTISDNENHTFGQPLLAPVESAEDHPEVAGQSMSNLSAIAPSEHPSQRTVSPNQQDPVSIDQSAAGGDGLTPSVTSRPDISTTAPPS